MMAAMMAASPAQGIPIANPSPGLQIFQRKALPPPAPAVIAAPPEPPAAPAPLALEDKRDPEATPSADETSHGQPLSVGTFLSAVSTALNNIR